MFCVSCAAHGPGRVFKGARPGSEGGLRDRLQTPGVLLRAGRECGVGTICRCVAPLKAIISITYACRDAACTNNVHREILVRLCESL